VKPFKAQLVVWLIGLNGCNNGKVSRKVKIVKRPNSCDWSVGDSRDAIGSSSIISLF
jgi:hypothetical protein